jgi:hypothetical protein
LCTSALVHRCSESHTQDKTKVAAEKELEKLTEANRQLEADKRKMEERQKHLEEVRLQENELYDPITLPRDKYVRFPPCERELRMNSF